MQGERRGLTPGGTDAGGNQGNGYKGDREMQREWMQGTGRGWMQLECKQGDRSLTCRHAAVVQAQKHLRLPGKSRINNSATSAHQVSGEKKGLPFLAMIVPSSKARLGGMGRKIQPLAWPWNRKLRDLCFCGHHSPGSQQSPSASGCGKGIPMPGDAW